VQGQVDAGEWIPERLGDVPRMMWTDFWGTRHMPRETSEPGAQAQGRHGPAGALPGIGSDTEEIFLSSSLNIMQGEMVALSTYPASMSIYSLSKIAQSSLIRYYSAYLRLRAHIIMTPNIFGGLNPATSLIGQMQHALRNGHDFVLRNPAVLKRFVRMDSFCKYVLALLVDLFERYSGYDDIPRFEVSSIDYVPRCTVEEFARRQWINMGGQSDKLKLA
jgi:hypothetical protein